jgi:hypothetical protein
MDFVDAEAEAEAPAPLPTRGKAAGKKKKGGNSVLNLLSREVRHARARVWTCAPSKRCVDSVRARDTTSLCLLRRSQRQDMLCPRPPGLISLGTHPSGHVRVLWTQAFLTDVDVTTAQDVRHGDDQQVCCGRRR